MALAFTSILTFAIVTILIFKQPVLKLPFTTKQVKVDYGFAPILGLVLLISTFSINQESIMNGIIGNATIQPYAILILFLALAYICISLDTTGLFAYLALCATRAAGNSGKKLFLYFFLLSSFLTMFTSNDIVILTITPIIYYFAKNINADPMPFLIAQFFAANIWSAALYTGNPTNIIVAQAYNMSFIQYSKLMVLPALVAGTTCFVMLLITFKNKVPDKTAASECDPTTALKDKQGAIFGTICLATCLFCLNFSSWLNMTIWQITLAFASVVAARDALSSIKLLKKERPKEMNSLVLIQNLRRMPWKIIPFIVSMFIFVESLLTTGYVKNFAESFTLFTGNVISACFGMMIVSSLVANVMSNQPMTILLTKTVQSFSFAGTFEAEKASLFALILGSNFAANFTPIGSLAGLMWSKLLKDKGITISFKQFSKYGLIIMPLTLVAACLMLIIEVLFWI